MRTDDLTGCDKFAILVWKNFCVIMNNRLRMIATLIMTLIISLILIGSRIGSEVKHIGLEEPPILNSSEIIDSLKATLDNFEEYRKIIRMHNPNFQHSVYVPQNIIAFASRNEEHYPIFSEALSHFGVDQLTPLFFEYCQDLRADMAKGHYFVGICFNSELPNLEYDLIFPSEVRTRFEFLGDGWMSSLIYDPRVNHAIRIYGVNQLHDGHIGDGTLAMQYIMTAMLKPFLSNDQLEYFTKSIEITKLPHGKSYIDHLILYHSKAVSILIVLVYLFPSIFVIDLIVSEKKNAVRSYLKLKSIGLVVQNISWITILVTITTLISLFMIIILKIRWKDGHAIFDQTSGFALMLILFLYCICNACFVVAVSGLVMKEKSGRKLIICGWILFLVWSLNEDNSSMGVTNYLFYNSLLCTVLNHSFDLESYTNGFKFRTLIYNADTNEHLFAAISFVVTGFMFFLLSLITDQFNPGLYGERYVWFKPLIKKFKDAWNKNPVTKSFIDTHILSKASRGITRGTTRMHHNKFAFESGKFEEIEGTKIQVQRLFKKFGNKCCANDISFSVSENMLFTLMGRNGCGKTVMMAMLCSFMSPDGGKIFLNGFDLDTNRKKAYKSLGVGLGDKCLIDYLTVSQQIIFQAAVKGVPFQIVDEDPVYSYCVALELYNYNDTITKELNTSVRSDLAVLCALCGDSDIVILDELDSNVDQSFNTCLLSLLNDLKDTRTIVVATNSYVFAEQVSDHVAFLSDGELICAGSPSFLKTAFGNYFVLVIYKMKSFNKTNMLHIQRIIDKYIPNIKSEDPPWNLIYVSYAIGRYYSEEITYILKEIEPAMTELRIKNLVIREMSLQDIFVKIREKNAPVRSDVENTYDIIRNYIETKQGRSPFLFKYKLLTGHALFKQRLHGFWHRQIWINHTGSNLLFVYLLLPLLLLCFPYMRYYKMRSNMENHPRELNLNAFRDPKVILAVPHRDYLSNRNDRVMANTVWYFREVFFSRGAEIIDTGDSSLLDFFLEIEDSFGSVYPHLLGAIGKNSMENDYPHLVVSFNGFILHSVPIMYTLVSDCILKSLIGSNFTVSTTFAPLEFENKNETTKILIFHFAALVVGLCVVLTMHLSSAEFLSERLLNEKSRHIIGNYRGWEYWITAYASSLLNISIILVEIDLFLFLVGIIEFRFSVAIIFNLFLVLSCVLARLFRYIMMLSFKRAEVVDLVFLATLLCGLAAYCFEASIYENQHPKVYLFFIPLYLIAKLFDRFFQFSETQSYCQQNHIKEISIYIRKCKTLPNCCDTSKIWTLGATFPFYLLFLIVVLSGSIAILENWDLIQAYLPCFRVPMTDRTTRREGEMLTSLSLRNIPVKEVITATNISKYGKYNTPILRKQSFKVYRGECFGILGTMSCGKTTLIRLLVNSIRPTFGQIKVFGYDLLRERTQSPVVFGFVPENLSITGYFRLGNYMESFAQMIGVPMNIIHDTCRDMAQKLHFYNDYFSKVKHLSWGTKRKVMFALALMGNPHLLLLDSPLRGVDIVGREDMAQLIRNYTKNGGTVLMALTNYLFVEYFADRLGIMIAGKIQVTSTIYDFYMHFTNGYFLRVKLEPRMFESVHISYKAKKLLQNLVFKLSAIIENTYDGSNQRGEYGSQIYFFIPRANVSMGELFSKLMELYTSLNLNDIFISINTLRFILEDYMAGVSNTKVESTSKHG